VISAVIVVSLSTPSGTVLFDSCVVLFSLGCNPYFGKPSGTESAVSGAPAVPPPFEFSEPIEAARERIAKVIGKVTVPREVRVWHPAIDRHFKEDETRRESNMPLHIQCRRTSRRLILPFERRRLRILNILFLAVGRMNGKPSFYRS
jgi:hypothetical protein